MVVIESVSDFRSNILLSVNTFVRLSYIVCCDESGEHVANKLHN